jgi:hypothetical protein
MIVHLVVSGVKDAAQQPSLAQPPDFSLQPPSFSEATAQLLYYELTTSQQVNNN